MNNPVIRLAVNATVLTLGVLVLLIAASLRVTWLMFPGMSLFWLQVLISIASNPQRRSSRRAGLALLPLFLFLAFSVLFPLWILLEGRNVFAPVQQPTPFGVIIAFAAMWPIGVGALVWDYGRWRQKDYASAT